jgi:hypothetical protein
VRGLQHMLEGDRYCVDILDQSTRRATPTSQTVGLELLGDQPRALRRRCGRCWRCDGNAEVGESPGTIDRMVRARAAYPSVAPKAELFADHARARFDHCC